MEISMFKQIKLGITLLKYGYRLKTNIVAAAVMLGAGFIFEIITKGTNILGGAYIMIFSMYVFQLIESITISSMVQTSQLKKPLQTTIPTITSFVFYIIMCSVVVGIKLIIVAINPALETELAVTILSVAILSFFMLIYTGFAYKLFIPATIIFFFLIIPLMGYQNLVVARGIELGISLWQAIGILYGMIFVGTICQYIICCATYKLPLSDLAFKGIIKEMNK